MKVSIQYAGLDVHKEIIAVAAADGAEGEARFFSEIAHTPQAMTQLLRKRMKGDARLSFCYEAGPRRWTIGRRPTGGMH